MNSMIVTGCAGFIGSTLVERLLASGHHVTGIDNFSSGQRRFLNGALAHPKFKLIEIDILDLEALKISFSGGETVFHLAANADVRFGIEHPRKDLEQNTIATHNVLEAMRTNGIKKIAVATIEEAIKIRINFKDVSIMVLGYTIINNKLYEFNIEQTIFDYEYANSLSKYAIQNT